jgi:S-adenosylmethionine decarboxylase
MALHQQPTLYSVDLGRCAHLGAYTADALAGIFATALTEAGATIVHRAMHAFPGIGMTCVLILTESHAVLHTWPETGTVNIDIFSCSPRLKSLAAIDELGRELGAGTVVVQEIVRADGRDNVPARLRA